MNQSKVNRLKSKAESALYAGNVTRAKRFVDRLETVERDERVNLLRSVVGVFTEPRDADERVATAESPTLPQHDRYEVQLVCDAMIGMRMRDNQVRGLRGLSGQRNQQFERGADYLSAVAERTDDDFLGMQVRRLQDTTLSQRAHIDELEQVRHDQGRTLSTNG